NHMKRQTTTVRTATITIKAMATGLPRILSSHFAGGANIERSGVIVPQIIPAPAAGRAARLPLACSPHPEDLHGFQCGPESQGVPGMCRSLDGHHQSTSYTLCRTSKKSSSPMDLTCNLSQSDLLNVE